MNPKKPLPVWFWPLGIVSGTVALFLWLDKQNRSTQ